MSTVGTLVYRQYEPTELQLDGYPAAWHSVIKHEVRAEAGNRCRRCHHPYEPGGGEWTACDAHCTHYGERRCQVAGSDEWVTLVRDSPHTLVNATAVEARWRILTVHHLDGDKANCRWWNLVALCQRCHLTIQGKVWMERPWLGEHTEWFKPYVAGFYAWSQLGQDLTPGQVAARLDELLNLQPHTRRMFE